MKVAYVVPRYGLEVIGGAEYGARMLAERLAARPDCAVEVFTTCALDSVTWADEYREETVVLNGVAVHRFRSEAGRANGFDALSDELLPRAVNASMAEAERWIDLQGPRCPALVAAAADSDADVVVFYPYLFYPTVRGVRAVGRRAVMHPAAHPELPILLPVFREVFSRVAGLVFQTHSERHLVEGLFPVAHRPQVVMGLGVEEGEGEATAARERIGLGDSPFLLCVGRVDDGKGTGLLSEYFRAWKRRRPGPLRLVLAGQVVDRPAEDDDVRVVGPVDAETKWGLLRGAVALVQPSPHEAFSIILMEGWTAGLPALVNGSCAATREHCQRSGGGLWFTGYASFEVVLDRLWADGGMRTGLGRRGQAYARRYFSWPAIIGRYTRFLEQVEPSG